jgi:hypothetical protein
MPGVQNNCFIQCNAASSEIRPSRQWIRCMLKDPVLQRCCDHRSQRSRWILTIDKLAGTIALSISINLVLLFFIQYPHHRACTTYYLLLSQWRKPRAKSNSHTWGSLQSSKSQPSAHAGLLAMLISRFHWKPLHSMHIFGNLLSAYVNECSSLLISTTY